MICLRRRGARPDQRPLTNAARAARTALSTSSASQAATDVRLLPSMGLMQSNVLPDAASTNFPLMKAWLRNESALTCLR
jgi:hypothetical protein